MKDEALQHNHEQAQINTLVNATIEDALNLRDEIDRRRTVIGHEAQARIADISDLQTQVDKASIAGLENSFAIVQEAEKRRIFGDRIETLESKSELDSEQDTYHQIQLDLLVDAVLQSAINLQDEIERRRTEANAEELELITRTNYIQVQSDKNAEGIIENSLTLQNSNAKRRAEDTLERFTRFDEDGNLQGQINALAETCMLLMLNDNATRQKVDKIAESASVDGTNFNDDVFNDVMTDLFNP